MLEQDKCRNNPCHLSQIPQSRWRKNAAACRAAFSRCPNLSLATRHWRGDWTSVPVVAIATESSPSQKTPTFCCLCLFTFLLITFLCFSLVLLLFWFIIFPLFRCLCILIGNQNSGRDVINIGAHAIQGEV